MSDLSQFLSTHVWPWLAANAANVISGLAVMVSLQSYRLSRKNIVAQEDATKPDVTATVKPLEKHPGWLEVRLAILNHLPNDMEISEVRMKWPLSAVGMSEYAAKIASGSYGRELPPMMPSEKSARRFEIGQQLGPRGTTRMPRDFNPAAREYITIYVRAQRSGLASSLRFSIYFSLRKTDVRRSKRIVSKQRIALPPGQTR
jgi:hypothetical protein